MEEQRIGHMYWNLFKRKMQSMWDGLFPRGLSRSPLLPLIVIIALIGIPGLGYYLHRRGQISRLKREIKGEEQVPTSALYRPGGMDPVILTRAGSGTASAPEFRSATLLPGLGMSVLQITAFVPGRGEVSLLAAPSLQDVADGTTSPKSGLNDTRGAFEMPWGGILGGLLSPVGTLRANWRGHSLEAPAELLGRGSAVGGLLGLLPADSTQLTPMADGAKATAGYQGTDFEGRWLSKTDVNVGVELRATTMVLTVTAKNVGDQPEPMGIGWHPRFVILSGNRDAAEVRVPAGQELEIADTAKGTPSGKLVGPDGRMSRFQGRPTGLGLEGIDADVVNPKANAQEGGVSTELRDPGSDVGIRLTALSATIKSMRVTSPSGANYVAMGAQTNYDDPLGKEWGPGDTPAIATLQPGQTLEWKVKVEIFSMPKVGGPKDR